MTKVRPQILTRSVEAYSIRQEKRVVRAINDSIAAARSAPALRNARSADASHTDLRIAAETTLDLGAAEAAIKETVIGGGARASEVLSATTKRSFLPTSPFVIEAARRAGDRLQSSVNAATIRGLQKILADGLEQGLHPSDIGAMLGDSMGLSDRDVTALLNLKRGLEAKGVAKGKIKKQLAEYRRKLLGARAQMIARTESFNAINAGTMEYYNQLFQAGDLNDEDRIVWHAVLDNKTSDICNQLHDQSVPLGVPFTSQIIGAVERPPAHPNCRSILVLDIGGERTRNRPVAQEAGDTRTTFVGGYEIEIEGEHRTVPVYRAWTGGRYLDNAINDFEGIEYDYLLPESTDPKVIRAHIFEALQDSGWNIDDIIMKQSTNWDDDYQRAFFEGVVDQAVKMGYFFEGDSARVRFLFEDRLTDYVGRYGPRGLPEDDGAGIATLVFNSDWMESARIGWSSDDASQQRDLLQAAIQGVSTGAHEISHHLDWRTSKLAQRFVYDFWQDSTVLGDASLGADQDLYKTILNLGYASRAKRSQEMIKKSKTMPVAHVSTYAAHADVEWFAETSSMHWLRDREDIIGEAADKIALWEPALDLSAETIDLMDKLNTFYALLRDMNKPLNMTTQRGDINFRYEGTDNFGTYNDSFASNEVLDLIDEIKSLVVHMFGLDWGQEHMTNLFKAHNLGAHEIIDGKDMTTDGIGALLLRTIMERSDASLQKLAAVPGESNGDGCMIAFHPSNPEGVFEPDGLNLNEIHLTLRYLGRTSAVDREKFDAAVNAIDAQTSDTSPFSIDRWKVDHFGGDDIREAGFVAVVLKPTTTRDLRRIHAATSHKLDAAGVGDASKFAGDTWRPHLTIGYYPIIEAQIRWPRGTIVHKSLHIGGISAHYGEEVTHLDFGIAKEYDPSQPRDEDGMWTDTGASNKIPAPPGTTPIPEGHVRVYHYTNASANDIAENGLLMSEAKGHTYGEPDFVWASAAQPQGGRTFVEFSVPLGDPRWVVGDPMKITPSGKDYEYTSPDGFTFNVSPEKLMARGSNIAFNADIKPSEFIGVHEAWMEQYRYISEDDTMRNTVLAGGHDNLLTDERYGEAIRRVYADAGIIKKFDPSQARDENGMWSDAGGGSNAEKAASLASSSSMMRTEFDPDDYGEEWQTALTTLKDMEDSDKSIGQCSVASDAVIESLGKQGVTDLYSIDIAAPHQMGTHYVASVGLGPDSLIIDFTYNQFDPTTPWPIIMSRTEFEEATGRKFGYEQTDGTRTHHTEKYDPATNRYTEFKEATE